MTYSPSDGKRCSYSGQVKKNIAKECMQTTRTKMIVKRAKVAVQMPAFTANTVRRCKRCAELVDQNSDQIFSRTYSMHYLAMEVVLFSRRSKYVIKMAINISTPAATERHMMPMACPMCQGRYSDASVRIEIISVPHIYHLRECR